MGLAFTVLFLGCRISSQQPAPEAEVSFRLHPIFTDHMVLQRDREIRIWGWGAPGDRVEIVFDGEHSSVITDREGRWEATLDPRSVGGPHTLTASAGDQFIQISDILIGDVWLTSGQSNMEWPLAWSLNAAEEIAAANWPEIRLLKVPHQVAPCPRETLELGEWTVCSPESVAMFAAPAYFMARDLHRELGVPIGVIDTSWGGATLEAWTRLDLMRGDPLFEEEIAAHDAWAEKWDWLCSAEAFQDALNAWHLQTGGDGAHSDPGRQAHTADWASRETDLREWQPIDLPGSWEEHGYPAADGVFWFRREIEIPLAWQGCELRVGLGQIDDDDTVFFNGTEVGRTGPSPDSWLQRRSYLVPEELTRSESGVIAVRVFDGGGPGGFLGPEGAMSLHPEGALSSSLPLAGRWQFRPAIPLQGNPLVVGDQPQRMAASLFNSMIHPLTRFRLRGIAWCQGEANVARHATHRELLSRMIRDWRQQFGQEDFPFIIVQLASFDGDWPGWEETQWAQAQVARNLPDVALVVTGDLGVPDNLHYLDKADVGRRLALAARAVAEGDSPQGLGPTAVAAHRRGDQLVVELENAEGGLISEGMSSDDLRGFEVLTPDGEWQAVTGHLEGSRVLFNVGSRQLRAVRYHWTDWPDGHLRNSAGLPVSIFLLDVTDDPADQ